MVGYCEQYHYHYPYTRGTKIILWRGTQMRLKIFDHIIIMNSNHLGQWQFNQGLPQMKCKVQSLHLVFWQHMSPKWFKKNTPQFGFQNTLLTLLVSNVWSSFHGNHNTLVSNPFNNNGTRVKFHLEFFGTLFTSPLNENTSIQKIVKNESRKNFKHILKFHTRPNSDVKIVDYYRKEMFHPNFHFDSYQYFFQQLMHSHVE